MTALLLVLALLENAHGHTIIVWDHTPGTVAVAYFEIERDGAIVGTARADQDYFPVLRGTPIPREGVAYSYRVRPIGEDGSVGPWCAPLQMEPQDPTIVLP